MHTLIIDTDPGADDVIALLFAMAAMSFSTGLSASTRPLRAIAISCLPASMAAWRTMAWSAGVHEAQISLFTTKTSGSAT